VDAAEISELDPGTRVHHQVFGPGTVLKVHQYGGYGSIEIRFDLNGTRELYCEFTAGKLDSEWP
jgi:hypothetical protein